MCESWGTCHVWNITSCHDSPRAKIRWVQGDHYLALEPTFKISYFYIVLCYFMFGAVVRGVWSHSSSFRN